MIPDTDALDRLLDLLLSKAPPNVLIQVRVSKLKDANNWSIHVIDWDGHTTADMAALLFSWSIASEDKVVRHRGRRVLVTDCTGPSHSYSFLCMAIEPILFPAAPDVYLGEL